MHIDSIYLTWYENSNVSMVHQLGISISYKHGDEIQILEG